MIATNIYSADLKSYERVHPRFNEAFKFIEKLVKENAPDGEYEIDGKNAYAFISSYETKLENEVNFEAHKKYIDIQCVISGTEVIGFENEAETELIQDYKDGNDICFYSLSKNFDKVVLGKGEFVIIMPNELHAPCLSTENIPQSVRKIVVKILAE